MKPLDPRVRTHLAPAGLDLAGVVGSGVLGGALLIGQAFAVAGLVTSFLARSPAGGSGSWHEAAWWLLGITVARALCGLYGDLAAARAAGKVTRRLRTRILRAALDLGEDRLSRRSAAELGLLGTRGVAAVEPYVTRYLPALVLAGVLPPLTIVVLFSLDLWSGLIVLGTVPLIPVFAILIGLATRDRADRQYRTLAVLAGHFLDVVRGLPTLVTFNRARVQTGRIRSITDRYRRTTLETLRLAFASSAVLELIATLSVALVAVSVGLRLAGGGIDFRTALVVLLLAPEAYWPLRRVGAEFHAAAEGVATLTAITGLLDEAEEADEQQHPVRPHRPSRDRIDPVPIRISDLVVGYPGATRPALRLDSVEIPATGVTAVIGPSGSGKSTLVRTLLGELSPERGSVTLAGEPIDPASWRALVAQIPQTPWLSSGTIAENLRVGRPAATEPELWAALTKVALDEVVAVLPDGLETRLGEDGAGLSAGQRARLALARVVLADRPYVVLDEPTAHVDAETEQILLDTLVELSQYATVIVVAHRAAVVGIADTLIRLEAPGTAGPPAAAPVIAGAFVAPLPEPTGEPPGSADPGPVGSERRRTELASLLGTLSSLSGVALTATAGWLIARSAEHPPVLMLMVAIIGVRTFGLARPVLRYAERLVSHDSALRMLAETRAHVYDVLVPLAPARLGPRRGDLLTSIVDDVDAQLDETLRVRQPIITWLGVATVSTLVAFLIAPAAAVPIGALGFGVGALALGIAWTGTRRTEAAYVKCRAEVSDELLASLTSARQLVLWQADDAAALSLEAKGAALARASCGTAITVAAARSLIVTAAGAAVLGTAWLLAPALTAHRVSGPMTALLLLVPLALAEVLGTLPDAGALAVRTRAARARLSALEELTPAVVEPSEPVRCTDADTPEVRFENVRAGWGGAPVLDGFSRQIRPRSSIGITGPSGCGKSTLAALLVRHLSPTSGSYSFGGHDTAALGSEELRRHVSLVDDDPYVFASTLRENLRLASPAASDDQLVAALAHADLAPWYGDLAAGLDTRLGEGGVGVSGGERARLGIARALLRNPEVLVLDEPTAHLDAATARSVTGTVLAARAGRTLVLITHDEVGLSEMDEVWEPVGRAASTANG